MAGIRTSVLGVIYAALIVGTLSAIPIQNKALKELLRFISALAVTLSILSPVVRFEFPNLRALEDWFSAEGENIAASAAASAAEEQMTRIRQSVRAYILDKASALGAELEVTVELSGESPYNPEQVQLIGNISPYAKSILAEYMESQLGVSKEAQIWISAPPSGS